MQYMLRWNLWLSFYVTYNHCHMTFEIKVAIKMCLYRGVVPLLCLQVQVVPCLSCNYSLNCSSTYTTQKTYFSAGHEPDL